MRGELGVFRANPQYDLVAFEELSEDQRASLSRLRPDPSFFGVLIPAAGSGLTVKALCRRTAELFEALNEAQPPPSNLLPESQEAAQTELQDLVAEGVLERLEGGAFLSWAEAAESFYTESTGIEDRQSEEPSTSGLSMRALKAAARLPSLDVGIAATRLYQYNTRPRTPALLRLLPTPGHVPHFLGLEGADGVRWYLEDTFVRESEASAFGKTWWSWRSRCALPRRSRGPLWKLYLSVRFEDLKQVLGEVFKAVAGSDAQYLKLARTPAGLLRPDALIVYFADRHALEQAGTSISRCLERCKPQGVPFTCQLGATPALSWGVDPPYDQNSFLWSTRISWRIWIAHRLATALVAARRSPRVDVKPWQQAMSRLQQEGIEPSTWTPSEGWAGYG